MSVRVLYVLDMIVGFAALYALVCVVYSALTYAALERAHEKYKKRGDRK